MSIKRRLIVFMQKGMCDFETLISYCFLFSGSFKMKDFADDMEPYIEINFKCQKDRQKELIQFIFRFSTLTIKEMSELIEEKILILNKVIRGQAFLSERALNNLVQLFYMFANSCEFE